MGGISMVKTCKKKKNNHWKQTTEQQHKQSVMRCSTNDQTNASHYVSILSILFCVCAWALPLRWSHIKIYYICHCACKLIMSLVAFSKIGQVNVCTLAAHVPQIHKSINTATGSTAIVRSWSTMVCLCERASTWGIQFVYCFLLATLAAGSISAPED